jgi:anti-sigma B factor antagonist
MSWEERLAEINSKNSGLRVKEVDGRAAWTVLEVHGYLDTANSHLFGKIIMRGFQEEAAGLALEIHNLQYISSTGVGVLSSILVESKKRGQPFCLVGMQEKVQKVFRLLGFEKFFQTFKTLEDLG